ncbi:hypothetical protein ADUPG1_010387 [Aduncisulcus paluster]|uniref:Uncharacterized protein n=1 Tax=Aduncisulcus paluster TaxID=2918883 RepID=A0ABQ5JTP1_9EUKA|nr:hypothetical protein ADUPG1_010387 [Aduncisulcus paluster]
MPFLLDYHVSSKIPDVETKTTREIITAITQMIKQHETTMRNEVEDALRDYINQPNLPGEAVKATDAKRMALEHASRPDNIISALLTAPLSKCTQLSDTQMVLAIRHRVGCETEIKVGQTRDLCRDKVTHADHIYLCKKCSKGRTSMHDAVNKTLCTISNQVLDTTAILEPMHLQEQFGCNPDLVIHTPTNGERQRAVADVVIGCSYQSQTKRKPRRDPSHKTQKADTFLNSLERKKIIKYGRSRAAVLTRRQRERQAQESQTHGEQSESTEPTVQRQNNNDIIPQNPNNIEVASVTTSANDPGQRDQNAESDISQQGESEPQAQQISGGQNDDQTDSVTLESIDSMRRSDYRDLLKEFRRRDVTASSGVELYSGDTSSEDSMVSEKSLFQTSFWRLARLGVALAKGYGHCFSKYLAKLDQRRNPRCEI